ncbi:MAG: SGNH/GDSL hydrolase family protein [Acidimicrobiales bacterium]|nr:SGNH/GDSL hydrolase family protein [Acidimicrobiales bacterium]
MRFSDGVRSVISTVPDLADAWHHRNLRALESGKPLWVALGDSTAQGVGAESIDGGYVGQLDARLRAAGRDYELVNLSRTGAKMRDVLRTQLAQLDQLGRPIVMITCTAGANDLMASVRVDHLRRQMERMVTAIGERTDTGIVGEVLHGPGSVIGKAVNQRQREAAGDSAVRIARVGRHLNEHPGGWAASMAADRFHPNTHGYTAYANAFAEQLLIEASD